MQPSISEILKRANMAFSKEGKIQVLREEINKSLIDILIAAYDTRVEWLLPKGKVEYNPNKHEHQEGMLYQQSRTLYMFVAINGEPQAPGLTQLKREIRFIEMLESLHPMDAELMVSVKDRTLPYASMTPELINEAFPGMVYRGPAVKAALSPALQPVPATVEEAATVAFRQPEEDETVKPKKRRARKPRTTDVKNKKSA